MSIGTDFLKEYYENGRVPIGVKPKFILDEARKEELATAIAKYAIVGLPIDFEWIKEYNELVQK